VRETVNVMSIEKRLTDPSSNRTDTRSIPMRDAHHPLVLRIYDLLEESGEPSLENHT